MTPEEMLRRSHFQNRVYRLYDGRVEEIVCDATRNQGT